MLPVPTALPHQWRVPCSPNTLHFPLHIEHPFPLSFPSLEGPFSPCAVTSMEGPISFLAATSMEGLLTLCPLPSMEGPLLHCPVSCMKGPHFPCPPFLMQCPLSSLPSPSLEGSLYPFPIALPPPWRVTSSPFPVPYAPPSMEGTFSSLTHLLHGGSHLLPALPLPGRILLLPDLSPLLRVPSPPWHVPSMECPLSSLPCPLHGGVPSPPCRAHHSRFPFPRLCPLLPALYPSWRDPSPP